MPPIPISAAEYQAKFGSLPVSTQPIPITHAEYMAKFGNQQPATSDGSFLGSVGDYFHNVGQDIVGGVKNAYNDVSEGVKSGNANPLGETGLRVAGDLAGAALSPVTEGIKAGVDTAGNKLSETPMMQKFGASDAAGTMLNAAGSAANAVKGVAEKFPNVAKDVQALANIAAVVPVGEGVGVAGKELGAIAGDTANLAKKAILDPIAESTGILKIPGKISDAITPIDKGVTNELTKTPVEHLNEYVKHAEDAISDYSKPTPLELAGKKAEGALSDINSQLKSIGEAKTNIVKSIADIPVGDIAIKARDNMKSLVSDRLGTTFTKDGFANAAGRVSKISDSADKKMLEIANQQLGKLGKNPSFIKVDDTIGKIQDILYKRSSNLAVPVNKQVEGILKNVIGELKSNLKTLGGEEYANANSQYSKIINVRDSLNKALGSEGSKGGALMKRIFSPSDGGTKALFEKVKGLTGVDLVKEATLAKFVMEHVGDARQASLLEEAIKGNASLPTSIKGLFQKGAEKIIQSMQDPIGKAQRLAGEGVDKIENSIPFTPKSKLFNAVKGKGAGMSIQDNGLGKPGYETPIQIPKESGIPQKLQSLKTDEVHSFSDFTDMVAGQYKPAMEEASNLRKDVVASMKRIGMKIPKTDQGISSAVSRILEAVNFKGHK